MTVAVVCSDPGVPVFGSKGASVHLQAVLEALLRRGEEVHLLSPRPAGPAPAPLRGVHVHPLPAVTGAAGAEREASARRSDAAVEAVLAGLHAAAPLDLVLERYSLWGRAGTAWAAAAEVPSVLEVNAPLVREQLAHRRLDDRAGAERVARSALGAAGSVVCVSDGVAAWARTLAEPDRVHVVANGVDTGRITAVPRPGGARALTVGFVGTLKPWHGTEHLLDAVALLHRRDPAWRLLLVGDGPERGRLSERAADLGLAGALEATGALPPEDVAAQLHRMDVGCAPYDASPDFYFSPLKVYEYLAAGLPVVASDVPGMSALLRHGRLGELCRPGDPADLARALAALAADPQRRAEAGALARSTAQQEHTWDAVVGRVVALARVGASRAAGPVAVA